MFFHQGQPGDTEVTRVDKRFEGFIDTTGMDWVRCVKGSSGSIGRMNGESGLTMLAAPEDVPAKTYHCATIMVISLIMILAPRRNRPHPGGLIPGGVREKIGVPTSTPLSTRSVTGVEHGAAGHSKFKSKSLPGKQLVPESRHTVQQMVASCSPIEFFPNTSNGSSLGPQT